MSRTAKIVSAAAKDIEELRSLAAGDGRLAPRAQAVLCCLEGLTVKETAARLGLSTVSVVKWRGRFAAAGISGLYDARSGRKARYTEADESALLQLLSSPPPEGMRCWDGRSAAKKLGISASQVWKIARKHGLTLLRQRSFELPVSIDQALEPGCGAGLEIAGLYLACSDSALILRALPSAPADLMEEQAANQSAAVQPEAVLRGGIVKTYDAAVARALQSAAKRAGALSLLTALQTAAAAAAKGQRKQQLKPDLPGFVQRLFNAQILKTSGHFQVIAANELDAAVSSALHKLHPGMVLNCIPDAWPEALGLLFSMLGLPGAEAGAAMPEAAAQRQAAVLQLSAAVRQMLERCLHGSCPFEWMLAPQAADSEAAAVKHREEGS
ncbi:MAG: helix-turn-helix domain containing protein [Proteobacteria bacterium]|uniref:Helix-turn-helix domain containing protein n=1 Tax=Candidatus Avisuccinivibrio stercorigallinarum TaxID=2840704 RepID=A0A9D9DCH8_9GAMM|nr:helix-turn-helix domain containing protein [Candidatus Avisuccinivibrio stercorigallinarum]